MGLGPSFSVSTSHQWKDEEVQDLLEAFEFLKERLKESMRGQGAFYTYVYLAVNSRNALAAAQSVAHSTWQNEYGMIQPLQVLDLTQSEQAHMLYHAVAFSSDVTKENVYGEKQYKYCTVLLPKELVAYSHLPRISEGGVFTTVQDIPKFSVPSQMKGEIYIGTVLNSERWTMKDGYRTPFDYRIPEEQLNARVCNRCLAFRQNSNSNALHKGAYDSPKGKDRQTPSYRRHGPEERLADPGQIRRTGKIQFLLYGKSQLHADQTESMESPERR
jgi:hypothetical protein